MTDFDSSRDFCLGLFGSRNLSAEHIVDIWVEDAASVWPHGSEGVRVAFTFTYLGMKRLDGLTHSALERLLLIRALAIVAVLALGSTGVLAQPLESETDELPFAAVWHVNGVETSAGGYGIHLAWMADSYDLQLPGRRATTWSWGDDARQGAGIVVFYRVPATPGGDHERLKAILLLKGKWPRRGQQAEAVPVRASVGSWEFSAVLEPMRKPLDRVEYLSAVTKWLDGLGKGPVPDPAGPVAGSGVEHLGPVAVLEAIAADTEAVVTLEGEKTRVELRFEPDPELARAGRIMAQRCKGQRL